MGLYDTDFHAWTREQATALRAKDVAALDVDHLAEEIADLGQSIENAIESHLERLLLHLLKYRYDPAQLLRRDWRLTIRHAATMRWMPRACLWRPSPRCARGRSSRCWMRRIGRLRRVPDENGVLRPVRAATDGGGGRRDGPVPVRTRRVALLCGGPLPRRAQVRCLLALCGGAAVSRGAAATTAVTTRCTHYEDETLNRLHMN
jgi:hypothetical protein